MPFKDAAQRPCFSVACQLLAESLAHNPMGHSDPNYSVLPSSVPTSFSLGFFGL